MPPQHLSILHYSLTRIILLQLTLCWPPSWEVTVIRQGPAHCRTPFWVHPQIWPRFQVHVYAGCAPLAPPPTEDFVPYNFFSLAVPSGPRPGFRSARSIMGIPCRRSLICSLLSWVFLSSLLPTQQLNKIAPYQWLAPRSEMGYLLYGDCSLGWYLALLRSS